MKKNLLPWQLLTLAALVLPLLYLAYAWPALPAQVPTHFDAAGTANGYTSRGNLWLLTFGLPVGVAVLLSVLPQLDPKRRFDNSTVNFQKLRLALVAFVSSIGGYIVYAALHPAAGAERVVLVLVGLFFAFLGNYLTTVQPNYFVGIRTPWTLEFPLVWAQTHRVGGRVFVGAGLLLAALALLVPLEFMKIVTLVLLIGTVAFCYGYSFWLFRRQAKPQETA
ncbi:SdpI family protein [Hymenobacter sp. IS2118]|uniref:SdpI family protein n=1 Tax=Hymenobacter sp. IS2118 TaxID=1505605 RepID=UPI000552A1A2|nr:SdpI family protein [Hymenobacter sp. IS2118]